MTSTLVRPDPPMPRAVSALRQTLMQERYPPTWTVDPDTFDALETWLQAVHDARVARWQAAGCPDEWDEDVSPVYVGPHMGLLLKGVEILRG